MIKREVLLILGLLLTVSMASNYLTIPLTKDLYSHFFLGIGTPIQKIKVGLTMVSTQFFVNCAKNRENSYSPQQSTTMAKLYCNTSYYECDNKCKLTNKKQQCFEKNKEKNILFYDDVFTFSKQFSNRGNIVCTIPIQPTTKTSQTKPATTGIIGILGIGPLEAGTPLSKWFYASEKRQKVLSVCLTKSGGNLQLGVNPQERNAKGVTFSYLKNRKAYIILTQIMAFGSMALEVFDQNSDQKKQVAIILGTYYENITAIPKKFNLKILTQIEKRCSQDRNCQLMAEQKLSRCLTFKDDTDYQKKLDQLFPNFSITIEQHRFNWSPRQYFYFNEEKKLHCLGFVNSYYDNIVHIGERLLWNKKIIVHFQQKKLEIIQNQGCSLADKPQNSQVSEENKNNNEEEIRQSQKDEQKSGMRDEKPKEISHQGQSEGSDQGGKEGQPGRKDAEDKKETNKPQLFRYLLYVIILVLLAAIFCGGKIKKFCRGKISKLNTTSNELAEEVGNGSEMSVK